MPVLNGNQAYLYFNSIDLSGYWTDKIDFSKTNSTVEVTSGAGETYVEKAPGLNDTSMKFMVVYDSPNLAAYRTALVIGTQADLIFGPEGNVAGKPKFQCNMVLKGVKGPGNTIQKDMVSFELDFEGAAAPTATIEGGSVF